MPPAMDDKQRLSAADSGPDLVAVLQELCVVFRAESNIPCRLMLTASRTPRDAGIRDGVYRTIRELLKNISKRGRATLVTVSSGTYDDGSFFIRVENDAKEQADADDRAAPIGRRVDLSIIDRRIMELGVYVQIDDDSLCAWIVVPKRLMAGG